MKIQVCAKVNLGLNVVNKRSDGYHDLETVFYPVPLADTLQVTPSEHDALQLEAAFVAPFLMTPMILVLLILLFVEPEKLIRNSGKKTRRGKNSGKKEN